MPEKASIGTLAREASGRGIQRGDEQTNTQSVTPKLASQPTTTIKMICTYPALEDSGTSSKNHS
eukprot:925159-Rhodomonas_salina.1